jgi:hypothetical protein
VEEEIENMDRIQRENTKFDSYIQEALERVHGELSHMGISLSLSSLLPLFPPSSLPFPSSPSHAAISETQNQTIHGQIAALRLESAQQEAEWMRRAETQVLQAEQTLSEAKIKANSDLTER